MGRKDKGVDEGRSTMRLQAFLARAGIASRRASEDLIRAGRVRVNGEVAELGAKVTPGQDRVELNGELVERNRLEWIALHKPAGYVTTREDPQGRRTVYDLLPTELHALFHVGRLDLESEGLLLLTNDGPTAHRLLHPRYGITKEYHADVTGRPGKQELRRLVSGVRLEDGVARAVSADLIEAAGRDLHRVRLVLREGRKREVRRMLQIVGHPVRRLVRTRFGTIELGDLPPARWRRLTSGEVQSLRMSGRSHSP
jgi:23S rRNA pseudouridine2605 synthase